MQEAGCFFVSEAGMSWDSSHESLREGAEAQTRANAPRARARGCAGPEVAPLWHNYRWSGRKSNAAEAKCAAHSGSCSGSC